MIEFWHLQNVDWLRELPPEVADGLREAAELTHYPQGALIFKPAIDPEHVYLLESGLVRIYRESDKAEQVTFGYVQPGEVFGECAVFQDRPRESFAAAHEPSTVLRLSRQRFTEAIQSRPSVMFAVAKQIEGRFKNVESRVEDLVFRDARARLAHVILNLSQEFGHDEGGRTILRIQLTHAELATLIGTSRPTVSIALGELEDEGVLTRADRYIGITNLDALQAIANTPHDHIARQ
jgi:CRP-like cAMP-binding protein